jgi:hypothetical protein
MYKGGCFCGNVRYETDATPFHETICHCVPCRRIAGAPCVAWFSVPRASLRFTANAPQKFALSLRVTRTFCGKCGTSLTYESDTFLDEIDVTICSLDVSQAVPPHDQVHAAEKLGWINLNDILPIYPKARPAS